jgi:amino acid transporter
MVEPLDRERYNPRSTDCEGNGRLGIAYLRRLLVGEGLPSTRAIHQRLPKVLALPVFASDAISSTAYATEEIFLALVLAGSGALRLSVPVALAIAALFTVVVTSYRQTVIAYPSGGGAYVVARHNLGTNPGLIAGAALLTDYTLGVAVSIASSVAAVISAAPVLDPHRVPLCLLVVAFITIANLRGAKESGKLFAGPTYLFVASLVVMMAIGAWRQATGTGQVAPPLPVLAVTEPLTVFLVLRAFASGCAALTGTEAISTAVPSFRPPENRNAATTLLLMLIICVALNVGVAVFAQVNHIIPSDPLAASTHGHETVLSKVARSIVGSGLLYYIIQAGTMLILALAANTSFTGFPRLASIMARDGFAPRQLANVGDRLVFSNGILLLGALAGLLIVVFRGITHSLIPLYAVGVFISFTLSQAGMVRYWQRLKTRRWKASAAVNGVGAVVTAIVLIVVASAKFVHGSWIVLVVVPLLLLAFHAVSRHYRKLGAALSMEGFQIPQAMRHTVLVAVSRVHHGVAAALLYAKSVSPQCEAVSVEIDPDRSAALQQQWRQKNMGVPLTVLKSPRRSLAEPLIEHIRRLRSERGIDLVTVVIPEFATTHWWQPLLQSRSGLRLKYALMSEPGVVVTNVRYHDRDLPEDYELPRALSHFVLVLVPGLNRGVALALVYAKSMAPERCEAVHVEIDPEDTPALQQAWRHYRPGVPLTILKSPWRSLIGPVVQHLQTVRAEKRVDLVTVVIPEFATSRWWHSLLHNQSGPVLKWALLSESGAVVTNVRYHIGE